MKSMEHHDCYLATTENQRFICPSYSKVHLHELLSTFELFSFQKHAKLLQAKFSVARNS